MKKEVRITEIVLVIVIIIMMFVIASKNTIVDPPYQLPPPPPQGMEVKGIDYTKSISTWKYYSDEDIRRMRENNPHLIIKVPGRRILSREAQFEEDLEDYLEMNPDALDEYRDDY